jgi:hypothetical protein
MHAARRSGEAWIPANSLTEAGASQERARATLDAIDSAAPATSSSRPSTQPPPTRRRSASGDRWRRFVQDPRWFAGPVGRRRFRLTLERGVIVFATGVFTTGLVATLGTTLGLFRVLAPVIWLVWLAALGLATAAAATRRLQPEFERADLIALGMALVLALSAGVMHHRYLAAQADIGFYATDAIASASTGSRVLSGPYDHLLPGFNSDETGSRVSGMFGYSSLAALFVFLFGAYAGAWANLPLTFITTLALYSVARNFAGRLGALVGIGFWGTSLLTIWMSRWLMTENAAGATFWVGVLLMLSLARRWDSARAFCLLIALLYGAIARIESFVVIAWFVIVLVVCHRTTILSWLRVAARLPQTIRAHPLIAGAAFIGFAGIVAFLTQLLRSLPRDYVSGSITIGLQVLRGRPAADALDVPTTGPGPNWGDYALRYEWDSVSAYYLPWFLLVAVLGIALGIARRRPILFTLLLCVPYFAFIMIPPVTTAHPWFLRRLWVAVIPWMFLAAGAAVDPLRLAWRWPRRFGMRRESNLTIAAVGLVCLLFLGAMNVSISSHIATKREEDGVQTAVPLILAEVPAGAAIILDDDVSQYSGVLRFEHDGPVVPWFNRRVESFFASLDAAEQGNGAVLLRVPAANRSFLTSDTRGFGTSIILNTTVENPPRRDFRTYIASPPLEQGYEPLANYLKRDVPPIEWHTVRFQFQVAQLKEPVFLSKNMQLEDEQWGRSPDGIVAIAAPSSILLDTSHFRAEVIETFHLGVHLVYVQNGGPKEVRADDGSLLATLPSDGSGRLANASIPLPTPLRITEIQLPQGTAIRGMLLDLA